MSTATAPLTYEQAEQAWLKERNTFIGGSECYELLNIPQYGKGCARALAYRKSGTPTEVHDRPDDELLKRGHIMEPIAAALYKEQTGRNVRTPPADEFGFAKAVRSKKYPFLGVHTDRIILAGTGRGEYAVTETGDLELKSHAEGPWIQMRSKGLPPGHPLQVQHSLLVTGHSWGAIGMIGVFGSLPFSQHDVERNEPVIDEIKRAGEKLWNGLAKNELPQPLPDADDERCQVCAYRMECRGKEIDASAVAYLNKKTTSKDVLVTINDAELTQDVGALKILEEEKRVLLSESKKEPGAILVLKERITEKLLAMGIKPEEGYVFPGIGKVTCRPTSWSGIDQKLLKAKYPEVYNEVYVENRPGGNFSLRLWPFDLS